MLILDVLIIYVTDIYIYTHTYGCFLSHGDSHVEIWVSIQSHGLMTWMLHGYPNHFGNLSLYHYNPSKPHEHINANP